MWFFYTAVTADLLLAHRFLRCATRKKKTKHFAQKVQNVSKKQAIACYKYKKISDIAK